MKITIFASIGAQNLGDELILKNELKLIEKKYPDQKIIFNIFTYDEKNIFIEKNNLNYLEYFPIGIKKPKNFFRNIKNYYILIKTLRNSDKIIIGGGGIIYDNEIQSVGNPLNTWIFRVFLCKILKKDIIFFACGINIKNEKNLNKVKKIFESAKEVFIRDQASFDLLKKLGIKSEIINDPVFSDAGEYKKGKNLFIKKINSSDFDIKKLENIDFKNKKIGLSLRGGYIKNEQKSIENIINLINKKGGKIILIPHSFHKTDKLANDFIFLKTFAQKYKLEISENMQKSYDIYKQKKIDLCIAMRLHSIILSYDYDIPFIVLSYSKKTEEILANIS